MSSHSPLKSTSNDHVNTNGSHPTGAGVAVASARQAVAGPSTPLPNAQQQQQQQHQRQHQQQQQPSTSTQSTIGPSRVSQPNGHASPHLHETKPTLTPNPNPNPVPTLSQIEREALGRKRKWSSLGFNTEEQESMERTTTAYHYALAQDQFTTLYPERPRAFEGLDDVVGRLVPYHIWQTCDEELEGWEGEDPLKRRVREEKGQSSTIISSA